MFGLRIWWLIVPGGILFLTGMLALMSLFSRRPANLGVSDGQLRPCPKSPNCVSTQALHEQQRMDAIRFDGDATDAMRRLCEVIGAMPLAKVVSQDERYLHVEFTSRWFRFVDDVEFLIDDQRKEIHFRSASRAGHSDLGVNRRRMETISAAFSQLPRSSAAQRVEPNMER